PYAGAARRCELPTIARERPAPRLDDHRGRQHRSGERVLPTRVGHVQEPLSAHLGVGQGLDVPVVDLLLYAGPAGRWHKESRGTECDPLVENESMTRQERSDGDKADATGAENPIERGRHGRRQLDDPVDDDTAV